MSELTEADHDIPSYVVVEKLGRFSQ